MQFRQMFLASCRWNQSITNQRYLFLNFTIATHPLKKQNNEIKIRQHFRYSLLEKSSSFSEKLKIRKVKMFFLRFCLLIFKFRRLNVKSGVMQPLLLGVYWHTTIKQRIWLSLWVRGKSFFIFSVALDKRTSRCIYFSYFSMKTYVVGTH